MMTEEQKQAFSNLRRALVACNRLNYCESAITELESALTQPASPALKLPETISVRTAIAALDNASAVTTIAQSYKMAWNSCIAETKRLNAPHTTPIEPICATGGAVWVKCSERMPEETEVFGGDDFSPEVLTINQYGEKWVGRTHWGKWVNTKHKDCVVHAWMPLPAAPEAE